MSQPNWFSMLDTPKLLTREIEELCLSISPDTRPSYVQLTPESFAVQSECYANVEAKIQKDGGAIRYGWQIWEKRRLFIEAEFHAIWVSPEGSLLDITPKDIPTARILFLPDPRRKFDGDRIDNIRHPLIDDPLLSEFFRLFAKHKQAIDEIGGKGYSGPVTLRGLNLERFERIQFLEMALARKYASRNDPCACRSGKKIKRCNCGYGTLIGIG